jgi:hypothetical protein
MDSTVNLSLDGAAIGAAKVVLDRQAPGGLDLGNLEEYAAAVP